jgi:tetratricopeptide (TPR) repeat protein
VRAYRQRRYDLAFKLLPDAMTWNATWSPFTVIQLIQCQFCEINMLLLEGRALELELISRFTWAGLEGRAATTGVPKNWAVANNLAIAWMLQLKYEEAANMFATGLSKKLSKKVRLVLLNNLAVCQVYSHQIDAAEKTLSEAFSLLGSKIETHPGARLVFIRGLIEFERGQLDAAAKSLELAEAINKKKNGTKDFQAQCMAALARVRHGQGRLDESELHFRNAIDLLAASDNPHYISLAEHLHFYARLLMDQGNIEGAEKQVARAQRYYDFFVDRETLAVNHFRARLNNRKRIRASAELLTLTKREPLLEARD